ncbi:adaptor-related protein complex 3 sigma 1 subunit, isoform CRA_a [Paraphysoderma sedebokerense]|nr:adaptor-related protein complex 3 sigma 1 subunit, isoform CRA_a [Paraphysoderma sedebokerense]
MIRFALIFNNHGKPRLSKFYSNIDTATQQSLLQEIFSILNNRPPNLCNFIDSASLPAINASTLSNLGLSNIKICWRHYATLYFVMVCDDSESELAMLDLIQVFVESLDRVFENVCELDLIFHFEDVHNILSECIAGGLVLETNISDIVNNYKEHGKKPMASRRE